MDTNDRVLIGSVSIVGLMAAIAIIVSAVSLNRPMAPSANIYTGNLQSPEEQALDKLVPNTNSRRKRSTLNVNGYPIVIDAGGSSLDKQTNKRVWTLHIGHDYGAHEYIDKQGYLQGFSKDMVASVCEMAGIDCRLVWDKYSNCWDSQPGQHPVGGKGLLGGWYDACMGWYTTLERLHVFSFSQAYIKPPMSYFFVKPGKNFIPDNITNKTIGFIDGWASDEKCLARLSSSIKGAFLPKGYVVHAASASELYQLIIDGKVEAGFASYETMQYYRDNKLLTLINKPYNCLLDGNAVMTRKDSPFAELWNKGFSKFRSSGKFKNLCETGKQVHGKYGNIECVDS